MSTETPGPIEAWVVTNRRCFIDANYPGWYGDALAKAREWDATMRANVDLLDSALNTIARLTRQRDALAVALRRVYDDFVDVTLSDVEAALASLEDA